MCGGKLRLRRCKTFSGKDSGPGDGLQMVGQQKTRERWNYFSKYLEQNWGSYCLGLVMRVEMIVP